MYKKADTTGLPEGTDWNTLFEFSDDGENWTKPDRCINIDPRDGLSYMRRTKDWYILIRPVPQWEPVPGEVYIVWDDGDQLPNFGRYKGKDRGQFMATDGAFILYNWKHIARIDHLTKVPTSVDELKELAGEGNWL
jgi:hypothetical protein